MTTQKSRQSNTTNKHSQTIWMFTPQHCYEWWKKEESVKISPQHVNNSIKHQEFLCLMNCVNVSLTWTFNFFNKQSFLDNSCWSSRKVAFFSYWIRKENDDVCDLKQETRFSSDKVCYWWSIKRDKSNSPLNAANAKMAWKAFLMWWS